MAKFQELTDDQWALIQHFMNWSPPKERGKPRTNLKKVWNAIFYILIHGCRWEDLPIDSKYAHRATAHRWLMFWQKAGVFDRVVTELLKKAAAEGKIDWNRLIGDGSFSPGTRRRD
jgi:transposase